MSTAATSTSSAPFAPLGEQAEDVQMDPVDSVDNTTTDEPMEPVSVNSDIKERLLMPTIHLAPNKIATKLPSRLFDAISWNAQALFDLCFLPALTQKAPLRVPLITPRGASVTTATKLVN